MHICEEQVLCGVFGEDKCALRLWRDVETEEIKWE